MLAAGYGLEFFRKDTKFMRGPGGTGGREKCKAKAPSGLGLQWPANSSNKRLLQTMDAEAETPMTPRREAVLEALHVSGELPDLFDEDEEQQEWNLWLINQMELPDASRGRILPTENEMRAAQAHRRKQRKKEWKVKSRAANQRPQSSDSRVTRNQADNHIDEWKQLCMLKWFDDNRETPYPSSEQVEEWVHELELSKEQIQSYMGKRRADQKRGDASAAARRARRAKPSPSALQELGGAGSDGSLEV